MNLNFIYNYFTKLFLDLNAFIGSHMNLIMISLMLIVLICVILSEIKTILSSESRLSIYSEFKIVIINYQYIPMAQCKFGFLKWWIPLKENIPNIKFNDDAKFHNSSKALHFLNSKIIEIELNKTMKDRPLETIYSTI
jgi:hypothetical protein